MKKDRQPQLQHAHPVVQLLTVGQVAAYLNVHRTTVYDFINLAGLPVTRLGPHTVRIDVIDLKAWVDQRKQQAEHQHRKEA